MSGMPLILSADMACRVMKTWMESVSQGDDGRRWGEDLDGALDRSNAGRLPASEVELQQSVTEDHQRHVIFDDHGAIGKCRDALAPGLSVAGAFESSAPNEPLRSQQTVLLRGRDGSVSPETYGQSRLIGEVIVPPAQPTRAVAGSESHRVIEKEERSPVPWFVER